MHSDDISQEILDGYIIRSYSALATPKGMLTGAIEAAKAVLQGNPQDEALAWMRQLKGLTPEKLNEWKEMIRKLVEDGAVCTAGGAAAIHAEEDRYDSILDSFGTADRE